jgi:hypothetical protein
MSRVTDATPRLNVNVVKAEQRQINTSQPVSRVLYGVAPVMAIHLGCPLLDTSSNQPGQRLGNMPGNLFRACTCCPYSVLLPAGFTMPRLLPAARCALTAPFHPYLERVRGGLLSVALSLGLPPPDVIRRCVSVEPGLSSATSTAAIRLTGPQA